MSSSRSRRRLGLGIGIAVAAIMPVVAGAAVASVGEDDNPPARDDTAQSSASAATTAMRRTTTSTSTMTSTSTTTTTLPPTTAPPAAPVDEPTPEPETGTEPVATPPTEPPITVPVCGLSPWGDDHPYATNPGPPDKATLVNGPNWDCANAAAGCNVSISTTWSDGVVASSTQTLTAPGSYTLTDDRGTTATFSVSSNLYCAFNGANFDTFWPPGT